MSGMHDTDGGRGGNGSLPESLSLALAVYQAPSQFSELLHGKADLPDEIGLLLRLAGGAPLPEGVALPPFSAPEDVREAALFFIEQVLLAHDANHYRVLGVRPTASLDELKDNHRLLMRLFHPDRHVLESERKASHAARINLAYTTLRQPATRSAYDTSLRQARQTRQAAIQMPQMRAPTRRHAPQPAAPILPPGMARRLPQLVLGGFALLAMAAVGVVYLNRTPSGAIGAGGDFDREQSLSPSAPLRHDNLQIEHLKRIAAAGHGRDEIDEIALPRREMTPAEAGAPAASYEAAAGKAMETAEATKTAKTATVMPAPAPSLAPAPAVTVAVAKTTASAPTQVSATPTPTSIPAQARINTVPVPAAAPQGIKVSAATATARLPKQREPLAASLQVTQPAPSQRRSEETPAPTRAPAMPAASPPVTPSSGVAAATPPPPPAVVAKAEPPPPPADDGKESLDVLLSVLSLLYEKGDLEAFLALFDENARAENGGKARIRSDYDNLFRTTDARKLYIYDVNWAKDGDIYRGKGSFQAKVLQKGASSPRIYNGTITLEVLKRAPSPLIRGMYHKVG